MFQLRRKKGGYRFTNKVHPIQGIISVSIAGVLILGLLGLFLLSCKFPGNIGIGLMGFLVFFGSIAGEVLAIYGIRREDIHYRYPILGILLNGVLIVICIGLYVLGMALAS